MKSKKPKLPPPPSEKEMKAFARNYTKKQWAECCEEKAFLDACSMHLGRAEILAYKILNGTYDPDYD